MKRTLTIIFAFLTVAALTNGQAINSVGFKSGISIANQTWYYQSIDLTLKMDYRTGFYGVATLDFLKSKYLSITTDIGYCEKGFKENVPITTANNPEIVLGYKTYDTQFDYFLFSPLIKVRYDTPHWIPYALLGLRLDYQLSYESDLNLQPIDSNFNKTIFGLTTGGGIEYKIKNIGINAEFQYQYDLTKLMDTQSAPTALPTTVGLAINNKAYIVSVGIKYYFNKKEEAK